MADDGDRWVALSVETARSRGDGVRSIEKSVSLRLNPEQLDGSWLIWT